MKRLYRKVTRKTRKHHKRHLGFLEMLKRYVGLAVGGA